MPFPKEALPYTIQSLGSPRFYTFGLLAAVPRPPLLPLPSFPRLPTWSSSAWPCPLRTLPDVSASGYAFFLLATITFLLLT